MTLKGKPKDYIKNYIDDAILKEIREALESVEYGTVTITIHSGRTMQIEVTKKKRLDYLWRVEEGGGI